MNGNKDLGYATGSFKSATAASGTTTIYVVGPRGERRWARAFRAVEAGNFRLRVKSNASLNSHPDHTAGTNPFPVTGHQIICLEALAAGAIVEILHDAILDVGDNTDYGSGCGSAVTTASKKFESLF